MIRNAPRLRRDLVLLLVGGLLAAMLITPAGAHVGGTVGHLWKQHLLPLAKKSFYTKAQSDGRYLGKTAKAADADKLDGVDSTALASKASPITGVVQLADDQVQSGGLQVGAFNNGSYRTGATQGLDGCTWVNFDALGHTPAGYQLDGDGMVHLFGVVRAIDGFDFNCDINEGADLEIFRLPAELAPSRRAVLQGLANNATARVNIDANGIVSLEADSTMLNNAKTWLSLDGLRFPVDWTG